MPHKVAFFKSPKGNYFLTVSATAVVSAGTTGVVSATTGVESTTTAVVSVVEAESPPPQDAKATVATAATTNNFKVFMLLCLKGFDIKFALIQEKPMGNPSFL